MTETQSISLDLITTPLFDKKHNINYSDSDFDGNTKFQLVFSSDCPDNISDCLNDNGFLTNDVSVDKTADIALTLVEEDDYNSYVKITDNVEVELNNDIDIKGLFLRKKSNNFVLMAMVNQRAMRFCDGMTFEKDNVLFVKTR